MASSIPPSAGPPSGPLAPEVCKGLLFLRQARDAALAVGRDPWEFAVEVGALFAAGLSPTDLRRLLAEGYVRHALEQAPPRGKRRRFRPLSNLAIPARTCFILTAAGDALADRCPHGTAAGPPPAATAAAPRPHWDGQTRRLCWRGLLVKAFRQPAPNQELLLAALEEEGWPPRIDDPLPQERGQDPRDRLREAVKALNNNQVHPVLRFWRDGTGHGVTWGDVRSD
jgi:hypothetical protein